uniref:Uncharacterized protein n=1 Tax=Rhizophora mucronata TaxID=61149 RepID=A0A2P2PRB9_RHIMU
MTVLIIESNRRR